VTDNADAITTHERETWDRCADHGDKLAQLTQQGYQLIMGTGYIKSGIRVLDIGCGPGNFTADYAELGADVVGIDLSPLMIEVATKRFPHLEFQTANVESLPFDKASFDVVAAGYVTHHLARPEVAFTELSRVLKPGARFIFVTPVQESQKGFGSFFSALMEHHTQEAVPGGPLLSETDPSVYESMLTDNGFSECRVERREVITHLPSLDVLIELGWEIANLSEIPADLQSKIEASTRKNAEPYRNDDSSYTFPDAVLFGTAVK
jgi:ubiquinone/menaquinone biosynthesis C-methylase UbiE